MKFLALLMILNVAYAAEVSTDCPAMNESREKNVKAEMKVKTKVKTKKAGVTKQ